MTGGPLAGPASAYPTRSGPAFTCLIAAKDGFVPGCTAVEVWARAEQSGAAAVMAATACSKRLRGSRAPGVALIIVIGPPASDVLDLEGRGGVGADLTAQRGVLDQRDAVGWDNRFQLGQPGIRGQFAGEAFLQHADGDEG